MRRRTKRILQYIYIPILLALAGTAVLYITLRPVFGMVSDMSGVILSGSTPNFRTQLASIYDESCKPVSEGTVSMADIQFPEYETCYARLTCDRLEMDVPVYWGDSEAVFREGAGQYIGSFIPGYGGVVLLGAHDSMYFEPLENVKKGDIFKIQTNYGIFSYKVTDTRVASDSDDEVYGRLSGDEQLVLYTCYPFGALIGVKNQRFYVFADRISGPDIVDKAVQ